MVGFVMKQCHLYEMRMSANANVMMPYTYIQINYILYRKTKIYFCMS